MHESFRAINSCLSIYLCLFSCLDACLLLTQLLYSKRKREEKHERHAWLERVFLDIFLSTNRHLHEEDACISIAYIIDLLSLTVQNFDKELINDTPCWSNTNWHLQRYSFFQWKWERRMLCSLYFQRKNAIHKSFWRPITNNEMLIESTAGQKGKE